MTRVTVLLPGKTDTFLDVHPTWMLIICHGPSGPAKIVVLNGYSMGVVRLDCSFVGDTKDKNMRSQ